MSVMGSDATENPELRALSGEGDGLEQVDHCLFCGSGLYSESLSGVRDLFFRSDTGEFKFNRCCNCRSLWLDHRPTGERLIRSYADYYTHLPPSSAAGNQSLRSFLRQLYVKGTYTSTSSYFLTQLSKVLRIFWSGHSNVDAQYRFAPKAPARIIDYGCGDGSFLFKMSSLGFHLSGVEYDPHLLREMRTHGIEIEDVAAITDDRWDREFEHVPDPHALLNRLFGWLKPGGTLYVELPNADATGLAIFGGYWRGLEAPRHFSLPTQNALIKALQSVGFSIERQHINTSARKWVWGESLNAAPADSYPALRADIADAPLENHLNCEFLTFVARRPD